VNWRRGQLELHVAECNCARWTAK